MSPEQRPLWKVMLSASEEARMGPPGSDYAAKIRAVRDWLVPDDELLTADERDIRDLLTAEAERAEVGE